jgi:hypothetical protein
MAIISFNYRVDGNSIGISQNEVNQGNAKIQVEVLNQGQVVDIVSFTLKEMGYRVNFDQEFETLSGNPASDSDIEQRALKYAELTGLEEGYNIDGQIYKDGDNYPKDADPNQEGDDPTPANAPTEDEEGGIIEPVEAIEPTEPIAGIASRDAGLLPTTQPTLAPLQQGVGLNSAVDPTQTGALENPNVQRPEERAIELNAYYTSSPLGLINSKAYDHKNGRDNNPLFSTRNFLIDQGKKSGNGDGQSGNRLSDNPLDFNKSAADLHNDTVYDISTNNIIEKLEAYPALKLRWADFAYCRDFGVYPNNRLLVCRRFNRPQIDDLTLVSYKDAELNSAGPVSTIVTWIDDTSNILEFNFGEEWVDAGVSFVDLLNELGDDMGMKFAKLGDILARGLDFIPAPGATELFQRKILGKLGIIGDSATEEILPSGTPNLVKEARQRKLMKDDTPGSGLIGKFNIKVKCAWEQKFISGVDPTIIYYEILQTILSFGGSQAVFYLGKKSNLTGLGKFLDSFSRPGGAITEIRKLIDAFKAELDGVAKEIKSQITKLFNGENPAKDAEVDPENEQAVKDAKTKADEANADAEKERQDQLNAAVGAVDKIVQGLVDSLVKKYRVRVLGIVSALTGAPSTPWHVTIGNPLRPILSSGDMECSEVQVNLGPQLSFNDLPSYIECEFTLKSARNLGIDEIMEKLNCGSIRVHEEVPSFWNFLEDPPTPNPESTSKDTSGVTASTTPDPGETEGLIGPYAPEVLDNMETQDGQGVLSQEGALELATQTKIGNDIAANGQSINPDPNSAEALLGKVENLPGDEYTVKAGDSISKIARNKLGPNASNSEILAETKRIISLNKNKNPLEVDGIVNTNSQSDPDFIKPGDKLFI